MPYPSRKVHPVLPEFDGTATSRGQTPEQRQRLREFVATEYRGGRSLRELAELTGRTQTAVRRALDESGVPRRRVGAPQVNAPTRTPDISLERTRRLGEEHLEPLQHR